jgi:hypothetical protein
MRFATLVAVFMLFFSGLAIAEPHVCAAAVAADMARLKVGQGQISRTVFVDVRDGGCCDHLVGYEAWVDLKQCQGSVVVKLSRNCDIEETYTRGACAVSGLKNFR